LPRKLAAAGIAFYGLLLLLFRVIPQEASEAVKPGEKDLHTLLAPLENIGQRLGACAALMVWFLLAVWPSSSSSTTKRYRCRVWSAPAAHAGGDGLLGRMLQLGRPRVEYICPYGHGTLRAEEVQISAWPIPNGHPNPATCGKICTPPAAGTTRSRPRVPGTQSPRRFSATG